MSKVKAKVCEARLRLRRASAKCENRSMATWAFTPPGANLNEANCGEIKLKKPVIRPVFVYHIFY